MLKRLLLMVFAFALLAPLSFAQPAQAQSGAVWEAVFYNNPYLVGNEVLRRQDTAISFNWGQNSPAEGVNSDNFSVRWATDIYLPAGTYRFYARADDNVRVNVNYDFHALIDTFETPAIGQMIEREITLPAGTHHIQVDYREVTGDAYVFVSFANVASNPAPPNFAPQPQPSAPVTGGQWVAQYYANPHLQGHPSLIQSESSPSHNWGTGSPSVTIPADNWSARWTTVFNLPGGAYDLNVRADDGVRVYVDGVLQIDEFHGYLDQTYSRRLNLTQGAHHFIVEYYEATGNAFLDFQLTPVSAVPVPPANVVGGSGTVTINTGRLNVRETPDPVNGRIIAKVSRGDVYTVLAQNGDGSWLQLDVNGTHGWVNAGYVVRNSGGALPVAPGTNIQAPDMNTGITLTATEAVVIRTGPGTQHTRIGTLPRNATATIVGRSAGNYWWQVNYNGVVGWVYSQYVRVQDGADINRIPQTG